MASNVNSELESDTKGGISWTTFKRPPGESKNGYFLCRNCGFEIIHVTKIEKEIRFILHGEYIRALDQGNAKLGNKVERLDTFMKDDLNCKQCEMTVGFSIEFVERDTDNVTFMFLLERKELVYENDSLSCKNCRCAVDKGDSSIDSVYPSRFVSGKILLKPIQNENGTFYDVRACSDVCLEYYRDVHGDEKMLLLVCVQCIAPIGLKIVSTDEKEKSFVGYILDKLNVENAAMTIRSIDSATSTSLKQHEPHLPGFVDKYKLKTDERAMSMVSSIRDEIENSFFLRECFGENVTEVRKTQLKDLNIQFEHIPHTQLLNDLCAHLGRKSVLITVFCSAICSWLWTCCSGVVDARASYRFGKENDILFVVVTKKKCQKPNVSDRPIFHRSIDDDEMSKEASYIIKKELQITEKQRMDLKMILDKHTSSLLKRHTNITLISISSIKSRNFQTNGKHEMEHKPCIVFYVHVKGFIPIDEDELPSSIDGYHTDIREGTFTPYVRESYKVHDQVKMGCLIQGLQSNMDDSGNVLTGTLGGFIDHPFFGLCCFTSAHAMLSDNDMRAFARGETLQPPTDVSCYQPCFPIKFGSLVTAVCTEGDGSCPGVEVAMIKVEGRQIDDQGRFPGLIH